MDAQQFAKQAKENLQRIRAAQHPEVIKIIISHFKNDSGDVLLILNALSNNRLLDHPLPIQAIHNLLEEKHEHPTYGRTSFLKVTLKDLQAFRKKAYEKLKVADKEKLKNHFGTSNADLIWETLKDGQLKAIEKNTLRSFLDYSLDEAIMDSSSLPGELKAKLERIRETQLPEVLKIVKVQCGVDTDEALLFMDILKQGQLTKKPLSLEAAKFLFEEKFEHPEFGKDSFMGMLLQINKKCRLKYQKALNESISATDPEHLQFLFGTTNIQTISDKINAYELQSLLTNESPNFPVSEKSLEELSNQGIAIIDRIKENTNRLKSLLKELTAEIDKSKFKKLH